jgi:electron transport complex protein RnfB
VDAIVGAAKLMHTVITDACTGCDLCVAPCPVDCIEMIPRPVPTNRWIPPEPSLIATDRQMQAGLTHG